MPPLTAMPGQYPGSCPAKARHAKIPNLLRLGLAQILRAAGAVSAKRSHSRSRLFRPPGPRSGKDTTSGHWELAGLIAAAFSPLPGRISPQSSPLLKRPSGARCWATWRFRNEIIERRVLNTWPAVLPLSTPQRTAFSDRGSRRDSAPKALPLVPGRRRILQGNTPWAGHCAAFYRQARLL